MVTQNEQFFEELMQAKILAEEAGEWLQIYKKDENLFNIIFSVWKRHNTRLLELGKKLGMV